MDSKDQKRGNDDCLCNMNSCFRYFDKNSDGELNMNEFKAIIYELFRNSDGRRYSIGEEKSKELFGIFDINKNGLIDSDEFAFCWNNWINVIVHPVSALLIVDVQNDFISGSMKITDRPAKQKGWEIINPINHLLESVHFDCVFYSLDWHPPNHVSFIDNIKLRKLHVTSTVEVENAKVFDKVVFEGPPVMEQILWPAHCVQNQCGSSLHDKLKIVDDAVFIYKGKNPDVDSYSAFFDNHKLHHTMLDEHLKNKKVTDLYICGLAYDVCVLHTALDALDLGYRTILLDDCIRGLDLADIEKAKKVIINNNGVIINSKDIRAMLNGKDRRPELGYKLALKLKANVQT